MNSWTTTKATLAALLLALPAGGVGCGDEGTSNGGPDTTPADTAGPGDTGGIGGDTTAGDAGATDAGADAATQDTGVEDTGPGDVGGDTAEPDVADAAEDTGTPDVAQDTTDVGAPDTADAADTDLPPPAEDQAFRVSKLELLEPQMCLDFDADGECNPVNLFVNAIIDDELTNAEEPLHVMGVISPFEVPTSEATLTLGTADCAGAGLDALTCTFSADPTEVPALFDQVLTKDAGGCSANPVILAPCFATNSQGSLDIKLLDIPFTFLQAKVAGKFLNPGSFNGITDGYIRGFMPVTTAAGVQVDIPGVGYVKLTELLKEAQKTTVEDKNGWVFEFSFEASRVELGGGEP